ncbi:MAG: HAMP domain-containing sensor histidine kinase, partial [Bacteroidota bacterium]
NQGSESGKIIGLWEITELKSLLKDLDAYAHTVAHDLKASVSQVISLSELINTTEMTENERTQMINYIGQAGRNMNSIIEELLKLARTRNLEEEKHEKLDVSEVVSIVLSRIKLEKYGDANIKLPEPDKWPVLAVNSVWFEEIWYNLITNAYKYGNGVIEIGWTKEKSDLVFWVKDNGDGLSESEQIEIFEAQPKNEEEVKDTKSHGLGLSIVKRIVSKMGGKVWVKSKPGKGSTFYFSLPEN